MGNMDGWRDGGGRVEQMEKIQPMGIWEEMSLLGTFTEARFLFTRLLSLSGNIC